MSLFSPTTYTMHTEATTSAVARALALAQDYPSPSIVRVRFISHGRICFLTMKHTTCPKHGTYDAAKGGCPSCTETLGYDEDEWTI